VTDAAMTTQRIRPRATRESPGRGGRRPWTEPWATPILILNPSPAVDGGRWPAKRVVGDECVVGADLLREGQDVLAARIRWRAPGERAWGSAPMTYDADLDRWSGVLRPDRPGRWLFTIEAWAEPFASWRAELERWLSAGEDVELDLAEGAELVERSARRARGEARRTLTDAAALLRDVHAAPGARAAAALDPALERLVTAHARRADFTRLEPPLPLLVDRGRARFAAWYELFPRSQAREPGRHGTFADAAWQLPRIARLGFDVVYLPPIHPIGLSNRKGRDNRLRPRPGDPGSPWAIGGPEGGHTAVHPELGTLEDFERFRRSAEELGLEVALDYALQCSPDHPWLAEHPDWFFVRADGSIRHAQNPPKKYEDIVPLNFRCRDRAALWQACLDVLLFWIERGVRTFRVDNPHTKPFAFWQWALDEVRRDHPDVVFLSEAFTRPKRMQALAKLGFTQSYTYFTWRNTAAELREYLTELSTPPVSDYLRPNLFVNTPDILHEYLQRGGRPAFRVRLLLAGTLSPLYGVYSGFELCESVAREPGSEEYLHSEKYELRPRDWDAPGNLDSDLAALNRIRRENRALQLQDNLTFLVSETPEILFYRKSAPGSELLIAVNTDPLRLQHGFVHVPLEALGLDPGEPYEVEDLLTGERFRWRGPRNYLRLEPAERVGHVFRPVLPPSARGGEAPGVAGPGGPPPADGRPPSGNGRRR
jgi:starch synthase (maltosyl-transferring)